MKHNNKGFTLIELLVVIVILLAITLVALPNMSAADTKTQLQEINNEIEMLKEYAEVYINGNIYLYNCITGSGGAANFDKGYITLNEMADKKNIKLKYKRSHGYMEYDETENKIKWVDILPEDKKDCNDKL